MSVGKMHSSSVRLQKQVRGVAPFQCICVWRECSRLQVASFLLFSPLPARSLSPEFTGPGTCRPRTVFFSVSLLGMRCMRRLRACARWSHFEAQLLLCYEVRTRSKRRAGHVRETGGFLASFWAPIWSPYSGHLNSFSMVLHVCERCEEPVALVSVS